MRLGLWIAAAAVVVAALAARAGPARPAAVKVGGDWARFGYDAARHDSGPAATGITAANVGSLRAQQVALDGTVDSSAVYVRGVRGRDLAIVTTTYGKTEAIDAATGRRVWRFTPPGYAALGRQRPDHERDADRRPRARRGVRGGSGRPRAAARPRDRAAPLDGDRDAPARRARSSPRRSTSRAGRLLVTTGGYIGDAPPYQGHVVVARRADRPHPRGLELALRRAHG